MMNNSHDRSIPCSYIGALTGTEISKPGTGSIIGVFHHGWYIGNRSSVWLLHDSRYGKVPFGIGIDDFETQAPYRKALEGSRFSWSDGILLLPQAELSLILCPPEPHLPPVMVSHQQLHSLQKLGESVLLANGRGDLWQLIVYQLSAPNLGITPEIQDNYYLSYMHVQITDLLSALRENNMRKLELALKKMIGLGNGLTPSMDDWLVGFLYVMLRTNEPHPLREELANLIHSAAPRRTNRISSAYLSAAVVGESFEALDRALFATSPQDMELLLSIGSSSGSDMLTGMVFAASLITELSIHI